MAQQNGGNNNQPNFFKKSVTYVRNHPKRSALLVGGVVIAGAIGYTCAFGGNDAPATPAADDNNVQPTVQANPAGSNWSWSDYNNLQPTVQANSAQIANLDARVTQGEDTTAKIRAELSETTVPGTDYETLKRDHEASKTAIYDLHVKQDNLARKVDSLVPTATPTATPYVPTETPLPTSMPTATPYVPTETPTPTPTPTATPYVPTPTVEPTVTLVNSKLEYFNKTFDEVLAHLNAGGKAALGLYSDRGSNELGSECYKAVIVVQMGKNAFREETWVYASQSGLENLAKELGVSSPDKPLAPVTRVSEKNCIDLNGYEKVSASIAGQALAEKLTNNKPAVLRATLAATPTHGPYGGQ